MDPHNPDLRDLATRVGALEDKITSQQLQIAYLVKLVEQATGVWVFMKWIAAIITGGVAVWAYISDHLKIHWG
jgi:hypothetical protein